MRNYLAIIGFSHLCKQQQQVWNPKIGDSMLLKKNNPCFACLFPTRSGYAAFLGAEVVFHMAALDSSINNYQLHYSVNVEGQISTFVSVTNADMLCCSFPILTSWRIIKIFSQQSLVPIDFLIRLAWELRLAMIDSFKI